MVTERRRYAAMTGYLDALDAAGVPAGRRETATHRMTVTLQVASDDGGNDLLIGDSGRGYGASSRELDWSLSLRSGCEIVVLMIESWVIDGSITVPVLSEMVLQTLRARIADGLPETWLTSSSGRSLAFVTNTERAMVCC